MLVQLYVHFDTDSGLNVASIRSNHCRSNEWRQSYATALYQVTLLLKWSSLSLFDVSMLHRLPPTISGRRPILNEIQPDLHPLEVLFDVKKLMDEQNVI